MSDGVTVRFKAAFGNRSKGQPGVEEPLPAATVGQKGATESKPGATRIARQLALAHYIERAIDDGRIGSYGEAARILGVVALHAPVRETLRGDLQRFWREVFRSGAPL